MVNRSTQQESQESGGRSVDDVAPKGAGLPLYCRGLEDCARAGKEERVDPADAAAEFPNQQQCGKQAPTPKRDAAISGLHGAFPPFQGG